MCGRYSIETEAEIIEIQEIISEVQRRCGENSINTGEIYPTNQAPVLIWEINKLAPKTVYWGFPRWDGGGAVINARAESALEKNMFRKSMLTRRCVVPSTGFFEWQRIGGAKKKDKYLLNEPNKKVLYMAAMTNQFAHADGGQYEAFTILTTSANESVKHIHDRMPVILQKDELEAWLHDDVFMQIVLARVGPMLEMQRVPSDTSNQMSLF